MADEVKEKTIFQQLMEEVEKKSEKENDIVPDEDKEMDDDEESDEKKETVKESVILNIDDYISAESINDAQFDSILEGSELSDDFKTKAKTIFRTAVLESVTAIAKDFSEEYQTKQEEILESSLNTMEEKVGEYLAYVAEEWKEDNKINLANSIKIELAECFISNLTGIVEDYNVTLDDSKVDLLESMQTKVTELEESYAELVKDNIAMKSEIIDFKKAAILESVNRDMTAIEKDRFVSLMESVKFENEEQYSSKAGIVYETYFADTSKKEVVTEEVDVSKTQKVNESIQSYAKYMKSMSKKD